MTSSGINPCMEWHIETPRLLLREFRPEDAAALFRLDSDPEVHRYLGNNPIQHLTQAEAYIAYLRHQYEVNGIGRWASFEKSSGQFIGWTGLKWVTEPEHERRNYYDVGYRLLPAFWGQGYATEASREALHYAFTNMQLNELIGTCHQDNKASKHVLEKCGLRFVDQFTWKDITCDWLRITRQEWEQQTRR